MVLGCVWIGFKFVVGCLFIVFLFVGVCVIVIEISFDKDMGIVFNLLMVDVVVVVVFKVMNDYGSWLVDVEVDFGNVV